MVRRRARLAAALAVPALLALASCGRTVDPIGWNGPGSIRLRPVHGPATYPNPFKEQGKTDAEIARKLVETFNQLFYGDPNLMQPIYYTVGTDQANIQDILHDHEVRTEGMGLGMMICLQMDKRAEFDRLWRYADTVLRHKDPPQRGYFESHCDRPDLTTEPCDDPYGASQILMALIFAHDRWGSTGTVDYEAAALDLLDVMRHKEDENGGTEEGVTNMFDSVTALPFDVPDVKASGVSRPSIVMPAYYDLWAQATGDPFWTRAAGAAREYWKKSAHPITGLMPVRAAFDDGEPGAYWENFDAESYRAHINMGLDWTWSAGDPWERTEADSLLTFFRDQGIDTYGSAFKLDGSMVVDPQHDFGLVAANGVTAMIAEKIFRANFVEAVWGLVTPTGNGRYYSGILQLTSLLILSGQYRVW